MRSLTYKTHKQTNKNNWLVAAVKNKRQQQPKQTLLTVFEVFEGTPVPFGLPTTQWLRTHPTRHFPKHRRKWNTVQLVPKMVLALIDLWRCPNVSPRKTRSSFCLKIVELRPEDLEFYSNLLVRHGKE
jgi:hypothetical protein